MEERNPNRRAPTNLARSVWGGDEALISTSGGAAPNIRPADLLHCSVQFNAVYLILKHTSYRALAAIKTTQCASISHRTEI